MGGERQRGRRASTWEESVNVGGERQRGKRASTWEESVNVGGERQRGRRASTWEEEPPGVERQRRLQTRRDAVAVGATAATKGKGGGERGREEKEWRSFVCSFVRGSLSVCLSVSSPSTPINKGRTEGERDGRKKGRPPLPRRRCRIAAAAVTLKSEKMGGRGGRRRGKKVNSRFFSVRSSRSGRRQEERESWVEEKERRKGARGAQWMNE